VADPGFAKRGMKEHGEHTEHKPKWGPGGRARGRVQRQSPWWG